MMNYLSMMSNCFKADIVFLEGKGLGVGVGVHVGGGLLVKGSVYCVMQAVSYLKWLGKYDQTETLICFFHTQAGWVLKIIFFVCHMVGDIDGANFLETNQIFVNWLKKTWGFSPNPPLDVKAR